MPLTPKRGVAEQEAERLKGELREAAAAREKLALRVAELGGEAEGVQALLVEQVTRIVTHGA